MAKTGEQTANERTAMIQRPANFSANNYASQKTIAAGTMNIGLLTSNATHLKMLLKKDENSHDSYWYFAIILISISILLQLSMAVLNMVLGGSSAELESNDAEHEELMRKIQKKNSIVTTLTALSTLV